MENHHGVGGQLSPEVPDRVVEVSGKRPWTTPAISRVSMVDTTKKNPGPFEFCGTDTDGPLSSICS